MKKRLSIPALLLCAVLLLAGCGEKKPDPKESPKVEVVLNEEERISAPDFGASLIIPETFYGSGGDASLENQYSEAGYLALRLGYVDQVAINPAYEAYHEVQNNSDSTDAELQAAHEAYVKAFYSNSWDLAVVTMMPRADYQAAVDEKADLAELTGMPTDPEVFHETDEYVYLLCRPPYDTKTMTADNVQQIQVVEAFVDPILGSIRYTGVGKEPEAGQPSAMPAFTTTDLAGNTVTEDIFAQKDLTVVNVWGTFCGPCIGEMPELGQWAKDMPDNVQLIGIVCDAAQGDDTYIATANQIMESAGCEFVNLTVSSDLSALLDGIAAVPTTFLVDKQGNIVGDYIVGAQVEAYKAAVEAYLGG